MPATVKKPRAKKHVPLTEDQIPTGDAVREVVDVLKSVADETRINVILRLAIRSHNVSELCQVLDKQQPAVSHHLALMRYGKLVATARKGKHVYYELTDRSREIVPLLASLLTQD